MRTTTHTASERRHAGSADNTIQAVRRSVVQEMPTTLRRHLGEMQPTMMDGSVMSHVSDMQERHSPYSTTLRGFAARMVLIAPDGTSHVSDMMRWSILEEVLFLDFRTVIRQKLPILLWERLLTMVFLLPRDTVSLSRRLFVKPAYSLDHPSKSGKCGLALSHLLVATLSS